MQKNKEYRKAHKGLAPEFARACAVIDARVTAGLTIGDRPGWRAGGRESASNGVRHSARDSGSKWRICRGWLDRGLRLANDLGVALYTAKAWLPVLEATLQVIVLRPYHSNIGKRLVKTPKVYSTDTGMLCHLAGLRDSEHAAAGPLGGAIFETAVLLELVKGFVNRGEEPRIHFWRTSAGVEVDFIVEAAN